MSVCVCVYECVCVCVCVCVWVCVYVHSCVICVRIWKRMCLYYEWLWIQARCKWRPDQVLFSSLPDTLLYIVMFGTLSCTSCTTESHWITSMYFINRSHIRTTMRRSELYTCHEEHCMAQSWHYIKPEFFMGRWICTWPEVCEHVFRNTWLTLLRRLCFHYCALFSLFVC